MNSSSPPATDQTVHRFVQEAGNTTQALGLGRAVGQVFAYLYFSQEPKNLDQLQVELGISKGSASTIVRQLEQWQAVRKVWIKGDRKSYYAAEAHIGRIVKQILSGTVNNKMQVFTDMLTDMDEQLDQKQQDTDIDNRDYYRFAKERLDKLRAFHNRTRKAWENPLVQKLLS